MWKDAELLILPTDNKASIGSVFKKIKNYYENDLDKLGDLTLNVNESVEGSNEYWQHQQLYVLSLDKNDKIKENDWAYDKYDNRIVFVSKAKEDNLFHITNYIKERFVPQAYLDVNCKKIIASNYKLIINQLDSFSGMPSTLPRISKDFIKEFIPQHNSGNINNNVLVEYDHIGSTEYIDYFQPKINSDKSINIQLPKSSWNREEIIKNIEQAIVDGLDIGQYRDSWILNK